MINKIRPHAYIREHYGEDGREPRQTQIVYRCPVCNRYIGLTWKKDVACDECGTFYDWGNREPHIRVTETIEW